MQGTSPSLTCIVLTQLGVYVRLGLDIEEFLCADVLRETVFVDDDEGEVKAIPIAKSENAPCWGLGRSLNEN